MDGSIRVKPSKTYPCVKNGPANEQALFARLEQKLGKNDFLMVDGLKIAREKSLYGDSTITIRGKWCPDCKEMPLFRATKTFHVFSSNQFSLEVYDGTSNEDEGFVKRKVKSTMPTEHSLILEPVLALYSTLFGLGGVEMCTATN